MMWEGNDILDNSSIISTNTLPVGSIATTIQVPIDSEDESAETDIFNDEEIEKAIDEIRNAIHNSTRLTNKS
jgi:protein phosphatase